MLADPWSCPILNRGSKRAQHTSSRRSWARATRSCALASPADVHTSGKRVLRLTREHGLLAPTPQARRRSRRLHEGRITVTVPDTRWATDATEAHTRAERRCAVFAIEHAVAHGLALIRFERCAFLPARRGAQLRALERSATARAIAVGGCDSRRRRRRSCCAGTASAEARTRWTGGPGPEARSS